MNENNFETNIERMNRKPFSKLVFTCVKFNGTLFLLASILFPRLSGYHSSGFEILSTKDFVFCDGLYLMVGIIVFLWGCLIQEGFKVQSELDDVL